MKRKRNNRRLINILAAGALTLIVLAVALAVNDLGQQREVDRLNDELVSFEVTATWSAYENELLVSESADLQGRLDAQNQQLDQLEQALDVLVTREVTFNDRVLDANDQILELDDENRLLQNRVEELEFAVETLLTREAEYLEQIEAINSGQGN